MKSTIFPKIHKTFFLILLIVAIPLCGTAYAHEDDEYIGTIPEGWKAFNGTTPENMIDSTTCCSSFGAAAADAVRLETAADIAVLNGGDFYLNLLPGEVTWGYICRSFTEDRQIATADITPAQLYELLEIGLSHIVLDEGLYIDRAASSYAGFPQISGITLRCDYTLPTGQRILSISLVDGQILSADDNSSVLRLAAPVNMLDGDYGMPILPHDEHTISMFDALATYIAAGSFEEHRTDRIEAIGYSRPWLLGSINRSAVVMICVAVVILILLYEAKDKRTKESLRQLRWEDGISR